LIETPGQVVAELDSIRKKSSEGLLALRDAEEELAALERDADKLEATEFLQAGGTVAERQAIAKLRSADAHFTAGVQRAKVGRIKLHLKQLSESTMAVQTMARMVELEWKTSR
jgi:hypothetical protein